MRAASSRNAGRGLMVRPLGARAGDERRGGGRGGGGGGGESRGSPPRPRPSPSAPSVCLGRGERKCRGKEVGAPVLEVREGEERGGGGSPERPGQGFYLASVGER